MGRDPAPNPWATVVPNWTRRLGARLVGWPWHWGVGKK
uniref:Uncharacterized protein n=1 Tax=Magnetospirillum gryphiswaldense TaxID=55518 RepID=A4TTV2_9PROT|nr:hypothetical protein MGR_1139 [Magnetospirillum gryphiswaldense MSR-1]